MNRAKCEHYSFDKRKAQETIARKVRLNIVNAASLTGSVHFGGNFSLVEILLAYYWPVLAQETTFEDFTRKNTLVLSKGHCGLAVYAVLQVAECISSTDFATYCRPKGAFMGHIKRDVSLGIGWSTGSLGHGLSIAMGLAKVSNELGGERRITCILGDGEMHEGSIWEALLHLSVEKELPLTVILDNNKQLSLGLTSEIRPIEPVADKIGAFGIKNVTLEGHDVAQMVELIRAAEDSKRAIFINANTTKGKGVSFIESRVEWHAKRASDSELEKMRLELTKGER